MINTTRAQNQPSHGGQVARPTANVQEGQTLLKPVSRAG